MAKSISWQTETTPVELRSTLNELGNHYPIAKNGKGIPVEFLKVDADGDCQVVFDGRTATVCYSAPAQAGRAVGAVLSGLTTNKKIYKESTPFKMLGIMLDCSRNAIMTVDHIKIWLRQLALLGYNMVMLYTEETYQLPGEPYFGYQRGAYSASEIKAIDTYAAKLNIEIIPCIQTLGHLEKLLRHRAYSKIRDTDKVLMVGEKESYKLIEKMVQFWKKSCRTDRIHIGMDETHDLGLGRFLDKHGYKDRFELFNEHLCKVVKICKKHGLKPMIWSDMYFRLGSKTQHYYDTASVIPKSVIKNIPKDVELVYWDYYHDNKEFYLEWIKRHRDMGREPLVGSGIWTWNKYWHSQRLTEKNAGPCIEACYEAKVQEIFFTQWGDNGAYCDHDSAFTGMAWCADKAYGAKQPSLTDLEKRFATVCGGSYAAHTLASDIQYEAEGYNPLMWDDPIFETHVRTHSKDNPARIAKMATHYTTIAKQLKRYANSHETGNLGYAYATAKAFSDRYSLTAELLRAYRKKDRKGLLVVKNRIDKVYESIAAMEEAFRTMWMSHNKPEGLETIQARFGMLQARYRELERRLWEYLRGDIDCIAELDHKCPPK